MAATKKGKRQATYTDPGDRFGEYRARRDFRVTPEPAPPSGRAARGAVPGRDRGADTEVATAAGYMIHKHHASRLHYDLRLEIDGALASWSVPRGPSYDPSEKRLAVQTEDHPIEYGGFEGRIPDGEYGAGDSLIWDRGRYDTLPPGQASEQRAAGRLHVVFDGAKLKGGWHLIRTRGVAGGKPNWIFFKASDEFARAAYDVVEARPESVVSGRRVTRGPERASVLRAPREPPEAMLEGVSPMAPRKGTMAEVGKRGAGEYWFEEVPEGVRVLAALSSGRVAVGVVGGEGDGSGHGSGHGHGHGHGESYGEGHGHGHGYGHGHGESYGEGGKFGRVRRALEGVVVGDAVIDGVVVNEGTEGEELWALDLLRLDGEDVRGRQLEERRELLESLLANRREGLRAAPILEGNVKEAAAAARKEGARAIWARRRGSRYEAAEVGATTRDSIAVPLRADRR